MPLPIMEHPSQVSRTASCWICGGPLSRVQQLQKKRLCSEHCRWLYRALLPNQCCSVWGRPLAPRQLGARTCDSMTCQPELGKKQREQERQRRLSRERELLQIRDRKSTELRHRPDALPIQEPEAYALAVIPSFRRGIVDLPEHRRSAFVETLSHLIDEAAQQHGRDRAGERALPDAAPIAQPAHEPLLGRACALCQGYCYRNGGEHAYLKVESIRRHMRRHPERRPRDVLAAYVERVGTRTFEDSCIYHGASGCTLPREIRSDTCDQYYCLELLVFQTCWTDGQPARGFIVAMEGDTVKGAAFANERGSTPVDVPERCGPSAAEGSPSQTTASAGLDPHPLPRRSQSAARAPTAGGPERAARSSPRAVHPPYRTVPISPRG
jgi:hypothetical protein